MLSKGSSGIIEAGLSERATRGPSPDCPLPDTCEQVRKNLLAKEQRTEKLTRGVTEQGGVSSNQETHRASFHTTGLKTSCGVELKPNVRLKLPAQLRTIEEDGQRINKQTSACNEFDEQWMVDVRARVCKVPLARRNLQANAHLLGLQDRDELVPNDVK